jgi:hypothetical protein
VSCKVTRTLFVYRVSRVAINSSTAWGHVYAGEGNYHTMRRSDARSDGPDQVRALLHTSHVAALEAAAVYE